MIREIFRTGYRSLLPLIYARTNYKLFLKMSFSDIDLRFQQLAAASDFFSSTVRPIPLQAPFGRSMLVLAPHQDDEAIGCGGALALQVQAKAPAYVVVIQDGADGNDEIGMTRQQISEIRNQESRRAAAVIGMEPPLFLNHVNLLAELNQAAGEVRKVILERHSDAIFVPFFLDANPDHLTANYILSEALKEIDWDVQVYGYEVWGLCVPNVIVIIDEVMDQKLQMLSCFEFANKALDYVGSTKGLNMFHSRMLGAGMCKYAERFFEIPKREYVEVIEKVRNAKPTAPAGV